MRLGKTVFIIALAFSVLFSTLVIRGLSESNLVWLEVLCGVTATIIIFIYKDREKLEALSFRGIFNL